jgi:integral membrane sensor domain MASE1
MPTSTTIWQQLQSIVSQSAAISQNPHPKKNLFSRVIAENILAFLLQYIGLMISTLSPHSSLIWFATGTAIALIFLRSYAILPGIFLGSMIAYVFTTGSLSLSGIAALIYTLQTGVLFLICHRFIYPTLIFYNTKKFLNFTFCSLCLSGIFSFLLLLSCYWFFKPENKLFFTLWMQWWLANLNGILTFSFIIIAWDTYFPEINQLKKILHAKASILFILLIMTSFVLLFTKIVSLIFVFTIFIFILSYVISKNYGWQGAISAIFIVCIQLNMGAILNAPFLAETAIPLLFFEALIFFQAFLVLFIASQYNSMKLQEKY